MKTTARLWAAMLVAALWSPLSQADEGASEAVYCPQCKVTAVRAIARGRGKLYTHAGQKMTCPDCRTAMQNFLAGSAFAHTCKTCGDLEACATEQAELKKEKTERAATCAKCKTTWVRSPVPGGKMAVYRAKKSMKCSDCEAAAQAYLATGEWKSDCGACGDQLSACR